MNTTGFSCPWDSGQVGEILVTKERVREEFGVKRVTKSILERVRETMLSEVEIYDQYLRGDVYRFVVVKKVKCPACGHVDEEVVDSLCGFYGDDLKDNGMWDELDEEWQEAIDKEGYYSAYD